MAVFVSPEVIASLLEGEPPLQDGIGGGAIAIPLFGMAGGHVLSGRGPRSARVALGLVAVAPVPGWILAAPIFGDEFTLTTPHGAWIATYFYAHMAVLELACAIPHRPSVRADTRSAALGRRGSDGATSARRLAPRT